MSSWKGLIKMEAITLYELEQKLKRMREQGADDNTPVWLETEDNGVPIVGGLHKVYSNIAGGNMGRRVIRLNSD